MEAELPIAILSHDDWWFPPVQAALPDGLLAMGGDLQPGRLLAAYRNGIFPWFNEEDPILWWSPDPRCVLFPPDLKISKSMQQVIRRQRLTFRTDSAFEAVIQACAHTPRAGQPGTWITRDIIEAYTRLYALGFAHSAECWDGDRLVGGLYGVRLGNVFFGESMFSTATDASKFAFILYVQALQAEGVQLIDCQMHTPHLQSLGATLIPRSDFTALLKKRIP